MRTGGTPAAGIRHRRLTDAARLSLVFWSQLCDNWKSALVIVKPETLVGWHRRGFRLFWRLKSRSGRPKLPSNIRQLIARMVKENPTWGQGRIADELALKLGIRVSPRTELEPGFSRVEVQAESAMYCCVYGTP